MNKKERINELTWKYFWQQKVREVSLFLLVVISIIFVPYFSGYFVGDNIDEMCGPYVGIEQECSNFDMWIEGLAYIFMIIVGMALVYIFGSLMYEVFKNWIESNWEKAKHKAEKEIK